MSVASLDGRVLVLNGLYLTVHIVSVRRALGLLYEQMADFKAGRKQALGALVGQVMRATQGKANPQLVRQLLEEHLAEAP